MVETGASQHQTLPSTQTRPPEVGESHTQGEIDMQNAMAYAFVVVAVAPLIGIWRGHMWAKSNGLVLRKTSNATEQSSQTA